MFKRWYIVRYGTVSLSVKPEYRLVKAFSRKNAYKRVRKTLPDKYLITDIYRCSNRLKKSLDRNYYEPDKRYDI